ncbi:MAG: hypothetical protein JOY53_14815 [Acidobacteriaceae bacterium]|nr:hypothetical protein [Acidobacteriaceae bacterium]
MSRTYRSAVPSAAYLSDLGRVAALTAVVKLAGGVKAAVSARVLGLSGPLDAYLVAFSITSFVCDSLAGTLPPALVPLFVRHAESSDGKALEACCGGTLYSAVLCLSTVAAAVLASRGVLLRVLAPGFSAQQMDLTEKLLFILAPMFPMMGVNAIWRSALHARSHFAVAAMAPVMTPLLATILLLIPHSQAGVYNLAIGSTGGVLAEMMILGVYLSHTGVSIFPRFQSSLMTGQWLKSNYAPLVLSNFLHGGVSLVDQSIASLFAAGSISLLTLGTRLLSVVSAIGPATVSTIVLPNLSRIVARRGWASMHRTIKQWLLFGAGTGAAVSVVMMLLSFPFAHLLLHGNSFEDNHVRVLSTLQALSFLQLPFVMTGAVLVRAILSLELNRKLISISILALVANGILDLCLIRIFGINGIVVSTALVQALTTGILWRLVRNVLIDRSLAKAAA